LVQEMAGGVSGKLKAVFQRHNKLINIRDGHASTFPLCCYNQMF